MKRILLAFLTIVFLTGCRTDWTTPLHEALRGANRLRVRSGGTCHRAPDSEKTLLDLRDGKEVAVVVQGIRIDPKDSGFHCMCCGNPTLEFYHDDTLILSVGFHHGRSLRWPEGRWEGGGLLTKESAAFLLKWLAEHGVEGPQKELEKNLRQQKESEVSQERWVKAMPSSLKPFWPNMEDPFSPNPKPKKTNQIRKAVFKQFPDQKKRILVLLEWYGSGAGPWSGFPGYECTAEELLLAHKTEDILATIQAEALTPRQIEGTARLFGGWNFSKQRPDDLSLLPDELKQRLLDHSLKSDDKDKRDRAQTAFGMKDKNQTR